MYSDYFAYSGRCEQTARQQGSFSKKNKSENLNCENLQTIGFIVYKLTGENIQQEPLDVRWFRSHRSVGRSDFSNSREVTKRLLLDPGNYVIVPCTFQPQEESAFVLRIFTEKKQGKEAKNNRFCRKIVQASYL